MPSKYTFESMLPIFRMAALFRNEANKAGFTDNGGAIHSAERILDIMAQRVKYPGLNHTNKIGKHQAADFSVKARLAVDKGEAIYIEHVSPIRNFTQLAIQKLIAEKCSDEEFRAFLHQNYQLVILTKEEAKILDGMNRSKMAPNRLKDAGIELSESQPSKTSQTP